MDDYGHHPTEIKATLAALRRYWNKKLVVIFQPHRFSRTKILADEFAGAFQQADELVVMDIYSAGEKFVPGVTAQLVIDKIKGTGYDRVQYLPGKQDVLDQLASKLQPETLVLTLGAGDVWKVGEELLERLKQKSDKF
jgi:UDP-N-acetylmuramate--alanine ligase